jgi:hypothetical protein
MSEATPAAETAETTPEPPTALTWEIHTVESWARAIIDDIAKEVASRGEVSLGFEADWRGLRFSDGSFGAAIKIRSAAEATYNEHRVKIS